MKLITILLFVFVLSLTACSQNLRIMWEPHPTADSQDLTYYTVFVWEGDAIDTTAWDISQMDSIGTLPHVLNFAGPYEFLYFFAEDKIIIAGLSVKDSLSRQSDIVLSRFYDRPSEVTEVWIGK